MKVSTAAQLVAWNVVIDQDLPVGTKVTAEGGRVTIHLCDGQPVSTPYSPEDSLGALYRRLDGAVQTVTQAPRRQAAK